MALTLSQRAELETIVKLLHQGEKPGVSPAINRRLVRVLREVLGDLAPGSDNVAFDERPIRSLVEALLAADTAWTCPDCPPAVGGADWDVVGTKYPAIDMGNALTSWAFVSLLELTFNREECISFTMTGGAVWPLVSLKCPNLIHTQDPNAGFDVHQFYSLTTMELPVLEYFIPPTTTGGASLYCGVSDCPLLQSMVLNPNLSFATTAEAGNTIIFNFNNCKFNQTTIDFLVHRAYLTMGTPASTISFDIGGAAGNAAPSNNTEADAVKAKCLASGGNYTDNRP